MAELDEAILTAAMARVVFVEADLCVFNSLSWRGGAMASPGEGFHRLFGVCVKFLLREGCILREDQELM